MDIQDGKFNKLSIIEEETKEIFQDKNNNINFCKPIVENDKISAIEDSTFGSNYNFILNPNVVKTKGRPSEMGRIKSFKSKSKNNIFPGKGKKKAQDSEDNIFNNINVKTKIKKNENKEN